VDVVIAVEGVGLAGLAVVVDAVVVFSVVGVGRAKP
jgi:hypothetical protein